MRTRKEVLLDIGELGWSLYLSAHVRWLKKHRLPIPPLVVLPGREALYEGLAPTILTVPKELYEGIGKPQERFGFYGMTDAKVRAYVNPQLPAGHIVSKTQPLDSCAYTGIFKGRMLFAPYPYREKLEGPKEILIFPRVRMSGAFKARNLPASFYITLIGRLCDEFKQFTIRTMGTHEGSYVIDVQKSNYKNFVGKTPNLQAVIDRCQIAIAAVGSQSAPPKLSLLQGVPTFIIGHEKARHVKQENWMATKCGFYPVPKENYSDMDVTVCINNIVDFVRGCL